MPNEADKEKAAELKREVLALRVKLNDPATPKADKPRLREPLHKCAGRVILD